MGFKRGGHQRPAAVESSLNGEAVPVKDPPAGARSSAHDGTGAESLETGRPTTIRLAAPSLGGVVRTVMIVVACGIALYLLWRVRGVVRLVGISLFFALALMPVVDALDNKVPLPRAALILLVYVLLIAGVAVIGYVVVPSLVKEVGQFSHDAPRYAAELRHNGTFRQYDNRYHISATLVKDARHLPHLLGHLVGPLKDVTVQAASFIGQFITVLAITFLLVLHGRRYVQMGLSLTGERSERYRRVIVDVNKAVAQYVLGNITISVLATIATWIVLSILGVPYALSLAFLVGFFDLLPLVGATLGAIVVGFATVTVDFPTATLVWIAFIIVWQRFEDYVVQPLVYGRSLRVNPIVTIVSVLAGAALLGILGALLAIPIAAAIQIVLKDWWAKRSHKSPVPAADGGPSGAAVTGRYGCAAGSSWHPIVPAPGSDELSQLKPAPHGVQRNRRGRHQGDVAKGQGVTGITNEIKVITYRPTSRGAGA